MSRTLQLRLIAVAIGLASSLAAFNALKSCEPNTATHQQKVIGHLSASSGQVERRLPGATTVQSAPEAEAIVNQEMIITQNAAGVTIALEPDGPTLRLNENSRFIPELDASHPAAFLGTLLDGSVTLLNPGKLGLFRLFQDGREIPINANTKTVASSGTVPTLAPAAPITTVTTAATAGDMPNPTASPAAGVTITASHIEENVVPTPARLSKEDLEPSDILGNDDIIHTIKSQSGLLQRCYLSYIHRAGQAPNQPQPATANPSPAMGSASATGAVTLAFLIQNNGKVSDAKLVRSDFSDTTLNNCVTEVIERTRFKPFKGSAIPVLEFPVTLQ